MLSGSEFNLNERPGQKLKNEEDIVSAIGIGQKGTHKVSAAPSTLLAGTQSVFTVVGAVFIKGVWHVAIDLI